MPFLVMHIKSVGAMVVSVPCLPNSQLLFAADVQLEIVNLLDNILQDPNGLPSE